MAVVVAEGGVEGSGVGTGGPAASWIAEGAPRPCVGVFVGVNVGVTVGVGESVKVAVGVGVLGSSGCPPPVVGVGV